MNVSRRTWLRRVGAGAVVGAALPSLAYAVSPEDAGRPRGPIRLHRNEAAGGPSPSVVSAIRDAAPRAAHRYAEIEEESLGDAIAALHGVQRSRIVLGCGSSEILRTAASVFAGPGRNLVVAVPTFDLMEEAVARAGGDVNVVPLTNTHAHDLDGMRAKVDARTGLVYVCNPNNPTGTLTRRHDLERFIRALPQSTYIVIDEAYHHFATVSGEYASFIDQP